MSRFETEKANTMTVKELMAHLKEYPPDTAVLILTASADPECDTAVRIRDISQSLATGQGYIVLHD